MSQFPLLESTRVAAPCLAGWERMEGNDRVRFCKACKQHVYNLSELSSAEAEELIREKEGQLCVRLYVRTDGTIITNNCPVGLRAIRRAWIRMLVWVATLLVWCQIIEPAQAQGLVGAPVDGPRYGSLSSELVETAKDNSGPLLTCMLLMLKVVMPLTRNTDWWRENWCWAAYGIPFVLGFIVHFAYLGFDPVLVITVSGALAKSGETGIVFGLVCLMATILCRSLHGETYAYTKPIHAESTHPVPIMDCE